MKRLVPILVVVLLAGCAADTDVGESSPTSEVYNGSPAKVIEMPSGISNVAVKCDGPHLIFVTENGGIAVIRNDEACDQEPG